ncbi:MAG TPA: class I SAM-dependent methyltransferase, partial [Puia sp.]|nr:class I SAM-dependent methyltransferase [Puia sp.]
TEIDSKKLQLEIYDGMNFPPLMSQMDILFLIDVLHHVPKTKQEAFLKKLVGVMKSGATLVIKDIDAANPLVIWNKFHDLIVSREIGHELSSKKVSGILAETSLEITAIQKITTYVYPHYTIVGKKP